MLLWSFLCAIWLAAYPVVASLFPSNSLSIMNGGGFLVYFAPDSARAGAQWIHCSVRINEISYSLDSDQIHTIGGLTTVQRFQSDICGVRVKNVQKSLELPWILYATDQNSKEFTETLTLSVLPAKIINEKNQTISATSTSVTVQCPDSDSARHCRILDEEGNSYTGCTKMFDVKEQVSHYWCRLLFWGDMEERIAKVNVFVAEDDRDVIPSTEETDTSIILNCQYRSSVSLCRAKSESSNLQLLLLDGHLTDRYSSYNTKINQGLCSLEIRKPLALGDRGIWRLYQDVSISEYTGCVFTVGVTEGDELPTATSHPQTIEIFHDLRSATTTRTELTCSVPYPMDYCYLTGPQGSDYTPQRFSRYRSLGLCSFDVVNITTGTWACGINDAHGADDRLTYYDVRVYNTPGRAISSEIAASAGDKAQRLLCKTILDLPIDICRYRDPRGEIHGLSETMRPAAGNRYRYHGNGLREGECGLEITELQEQDFGQWKCLFKVQNREYEIGMEIIEEAMSVGVILAIVFSVIIVAAVTGGYFAYKKFNRRRVPYNVTASNLSMNSHNS